MKWIGILAIITVIFGSCTTARIQHYEPVDKANGLREIRNPHYKKKTNILGYLAMGGAAGGIGYLAYKNPFVRYNSGDAEVKSPGASAAVAGLTGLGLVISGNYLLGGKDKYSYLKNNHSDYSKWAKKYSRKYQVVNSQSSRGQLLLIKKNADLNYTFRDMNDVNIFVESFPKSPHTPLVCARSYKNLPYAELPEMLRKVRIGRSPIASEIKLHFINSSKTLSEYISALKRYPGLKENPYDDGIKYIGSMVDVAKYTEYFKRPDKKRLIDKAVKFATNFSAVKYFNSEFPDNPYYDQVIEDIIPTSSDDELEEMVRLFPRSGSIDKVKEAYVLRASDATTFINRNSSFRSFEFRDAYNLLDTEECSSFISDVKSSRLSRAKKIALVDDASGLFLKEKYRYVSTDDASQKDFIAFVSRHGWLSQERSDSYKTRAYNRIKINANERYLVDNELDGVDRYVYVSAHGYEDADGEELSWGDAMWSTLTERINKKMFLKVHLTNRGSKEKKVKLVAYLNMVKEKENMWAESKTKSKLKKEYIVSIPPESTVEDVLIQYEYQIAFKDERSIWGRNYFYYGPDMQLVKEKKLFDFELEYYDSSIPSSQEILRREAEKEYGKRAEKRSSGSWYRVDSDTHTVLEDKRCYVEVKRLTDSSESNGCISIYSDDVKGAYFSSISTNNGNRYTYSNEDDDNTTECFEYSDFPLIIEVSYINKNDKKVQSRVRLERFYDYDVSIK